MDNTIQLGLLLVNMSGWWHGTREQFLDFSVEELKNKLIITASEENWDIHESQKIEWEKTIQLLKESVDDSGKKSRVQLLIDAISHPELKVINGIILEYDFKRRGLRMDAILICGENIIVIEFKRSSINSAAKDQVMNYCINLSEFHDVAQNKAISIVPLAVSRKDKGEQNVSTVQSDGNHSDWPQIPKNVSYCSEEYMTRTLVKIVADFKLNDNTISTDEFVNSMFKPSSNIIDAALTLYGNHEVSSIKEHATSLNTITKCTNEIQSIINQSRNNKSKSMIFMSGAPGAGKTLVGLNLAFSSELRDDAVFVTGNAPLVEVLQMSLKKSYKKISTRGDNLTGYSKHGLAFVEKNTVFKIVKAHHFLKENKSNEIQKSSDGDVLIIDEAQRTYVKGRMVVGHPLKDHEANLIVEQMEKREDTPIIVLLLGHNQHINRGERGMIAWLEAAEKYNWNYYISEETLALSEFDQLKGNKWRILGNRKNIEFGHLSDSIRYYRNKNIEVWADKLLANKQKDAKKISLELNENNCHIWMTRNLEDAKEWIRQHRVGGETSGMIASGKGSRLAAEGIFPSLKPSIAPWMLLPSGDIRSSTMLETAQNQFQIQGLELDYSLLCWDADLRRGSMDWEVHNISGSKWQQVRKPEGVVERKNGYRVLLTRARKGMVIFVPKGDISNVDITRKPEYYNGIANYLISCGAKLL